MSNLRFLKIGSIAHLGDGAHTKVERVEAGIPYFSAKNIKEGYIDYSNSSLISEEDYQRLFSKSKTSVRNLQEDDILFSIIGSIGNLYKYKHTDKFGVSSSVAIIRPKRDLILAEYLFWVLRSKFFADLINRKKGGSVQGYTNLPLIRDTEIPIPESIVEQKAIAKVLSDLDAKIELNNKINAELEAMAKLIYDYWFVQFDFPNQQGKPYKSSGGKMVYNEELKREIPEEWEVDNVSSFSTVKKGTLITEKTANTDGNVKVVSAGLNFSYFHDKSNYAENTITISASGASAGFINFWREPIFACDCTTVRGASEAETLYLLHFLRMRQDFIYQQARGSAQPHVYPKDIEILKIEIPPKKLLIEFGNKALSCNDKIANNLKQNQQLASLRDWLLPMLMNGQVRVKEAEEKVRELGVAAEPKADYGK